MSNRSRTINQTIRLLKWLGASLLILIAFWLSIRVTQPDFVKLITAAPKARQILPQLASPDLFARGVVTSTVSLVYPIPCGSAPAPEEAVAPAAVEARLVADPPCAAERETFTLHGEGFVPNANYRLAWRLPDGRRLSVKRAVTNAEGGIEEQVQARPIAVTKDGKPAAIELETSLPGGGWRPTPTLTEVVNSMFVTVFMALLATTFGTILAIPLSFLAARNITYRGGVGKVVYFITRSFLNIIRSYEPLVMATIFALIVGFGNPFAGVLALVIVTTASLGKMFSESVEGIDAGPIEAITATGANRAQVILYGVVPQIIPDFLSFTIYHWDINVRISTIIGFVGGGGIGYFLSQAMNAFAYDKAGAALLAIILVVWALDFLSAEARKRLT
jgi:phosphonate transport system permease protein